MANPIPTLHEETIFSSQHFLFLPLMIFCTALVPVVSNVHSSQEVTANILPLSIIALHYDIRRKEWNGMEWNGMEWNGMEWNGEVEWKTQIGVHYV